MAVSNNKPQSLKQYSKYYQGIPNDNPVSLENDSIFRFLGRIVFKWIYCLLGRHNYEYHSIFGTLLLLTLYVSFICYPA